MSGDRIKFGNIKGDVIGGKVSGTGNMVGKKVELHQQTIQKLHPEIAKRLIEFASSVDHLLNDHSVPGVVKVRIQQNINELAEEAQEIEPGKEAPYVKQSNLKAKIAAIADNLLNVLPATAETATCFTPLAPLNKVIGENVAEIVKAVNGS